MIQLPMIVAPRYIRLVSSLLVVLLVVAVQAGSLDGSFGSGGKVTTDNIRNDTPVKVFVQPDGKILVAGQSAQLGFHIYFPAPMAVRYNSNGTLDNTFGTGGKVAAGGLIAVSDALIQPDGKIVIAGGTDPTWNTSPNDFGLVRFNTDGSLDPSFGTGGKVVTNIYSTNGGKESIGAILLLPGGKILALGGSINTPGAIPFDQQAIEFARYNSDGSLDTSFGTGGVVSIPFGLTSQIAADVVDDAALLPDGRFLLVGHSTAGGAWTMRFNANGTFDNNFGTGGVIDGGGVGVTLQPDGKYISIGTTNGTNAAFDLFRFNPDGSPDLTFGNGGRVLTYFPLSLFHAQVNQVALRANGEIYAAGYTSNFNEDVSSFAIARYSANGALLAKTITPFDYSSRATALSFQSDGKVVVAGTVTPLETDIAVARYFEITNDTGRFRRSYDFNADGRDDIMVCRPGTGGGSNGWFSAPITSGYSFGLATDIIAPGDYTGDGVPDLGVFRPSTGYWYYSNNLISPQTQFTAIKWGIVGDIPAAADYDEDGRADVAVFRPSLGAWYIRNSFDGSFRSVQWGAAGDIPAVGDYDGDGKPDIAVFRPSTGGWYILKSSNNQTLAYAFGANGDRPVPADYDGDGTTDIAVFRPSDGVWYSLRSSTGGFVAQTWGANGDVPAPGDYDGDGKADVAVFRPTGAAAFWYILRSSDGSILATEWGFATDKPVPGN